MDIVKRNRSELQAYFVKKAIPSESQFADLIDGTLNCQDDGIIRPPDSPLCIRADASDGKNVLDLYQSFSDTAPEWKLGLRHLANPSDPTTAKAGLSITDTGGVSRLFIASGSGNIGIGTTEPAAPLHVSGGARIDGSLELSGDIQRELVWQPLTLLMGWVYYGAPYGSAEFSKDALGVVRVRGLIKSGTTANGTIIATLPEGCRPSSRMLFIVSSWTTGGTWARVDVDQDGNIITMSGVGNNHLSLTGITFNPEAAP